MNHRSKPSFLCLTYLSKSFFLGSILPCSQAGESRGGADLLRPSERRDKFAPLHSAAADPLQVLRASVVKMS